MKRGYLFCNLCIIILVAALNTALAFAQTTVYSDNFESGVGPEWTFSGGLSSSIDPFPGLSNTLGTFRAGTATLTLNALPIHSIMTIEFDLFIEGSWDGNGNFCCGPDIWGLNVSGGPTLLYTTFSNEGGVGDQQAYPGTYPTGDYPAQSGANDIRDVYGSTAIYHLLYSFPHSANEVSLNFQAQNLDDEFWSLDNVKVGVESCPSNLPPPILGFLGTEDYEVNGQPFTRYKLSVSNRASYPDSLFAPSPALPPCGFNTDAARTWVNIFDNQGNALYGFCGLQSANDLGSIWFALPKGQVPPPSVYITLTDRQCGATYTSRSLSLRNLRRRGH